MTRPGFWAPQELLPISVAQPATFPPGTSYEYRNTNYVLLGLVVEKVDGRPLTKAMQKRLFRPLGLSDTVYPASTSNVINRPFAHGYLHGSSSVVITAIPDPPYTPEYPAAIEAGTVQPTDHTSLNHSMAYVTGAVISTADDLATWIRALVGGRVLNAKYLRIWLDSLNPRLPVRHQPAFLGTQPPVPPWARDRRLQLGGGLRSRKQADVCRVDQPDHLAVRRPQSGHPDGQSAHGGSAGPGLQAVTTGAGRSGSAADRPGPRLSRPLRRPTAPHASVAGLVARCLAGARNSCRWRTRARLPVTSPPPGDNQGSPIREAVSDRDPLHPDRHDGRHLSCSTR